MNTLILVEAVEPGMCWPSGDSMDIAQIEISAAQVATRSNCPMQFGDEEGLGPWQAVGFRLSTGEHMELIGYRYDPERGFILRVDAAQPPQRSIERFLAAFGMPADAVLWRTPLDAPRLEIAAE